MGEGGHLSVIPPAMRRLALASNRPVRLPRCLIVHGRSGCGRQAWGGGGYPEVAAHHRRLAADSAAAQCWADSAAFGPACGGCRCRRIPTAIRTIRATVVASSRGQSPPTLRSWRTVQPSCRPVPTGGRTLHRRKRRKFRHRGLGVPALLPYSCSLCAARGNTALQLERVHPAAAHCTPRTCTAAVLVLRALQARSQQHAGSTGQARRDGACHEPLPSQSSRGHCCHRTQKSAGAALLPVAPCSELWLPLSASPFPHCLCK